MSITEQNIRSIAVIAEWTTEEGIKHTAILGVVSDNDGASAIIQDRKTTAATRLYPESHRMVPVPPELSEYLQKPQPAVVIGDEGGFVYYGGAQLLPEVAVPKAKKPLSPAAEKALAVGATPRSAYWYTKTGGIQALNSGERLVLEADYKAWTAKNPAIAQKRTVGDYCLFRQRMHADLGKKLQAKRLQASP